jgi:hypothetical protein
MKGGRYRVRRLAMNKYLVSERNPIGVSNARTPCRRAGVIMRVRIAAYRQR